MVPLTIYDEIETSMQILLTISSQIVQGFSLGEKTEMATKDNGLDLLTNTPNVMTKIQRIVRRKSMLILELKRLNMPKWCMVTIDPQTLTVTSQQD